MFVGPFCSGIKVNVNDRAKMYGSTIITFVNGLESTGGITGPYITGFFTKDKNLTFFEHWPELCVCVASVFAEVERQPWDEPENVEAPPPTDLTNIINSISTNNKVSSERLHVDVPILHSKTDLALHSVHSPWGWNFLDEQLQNYIQQLGEVPFSV